MQTVPNGLTHIFLLVNVVAMLSCSSLVIARRYSEYAVAGLCGVVVTQALGYGLIFDLNFFLRNLSVMGGLIMVLSDSWIRKTQAFAGLPQLEEKDRKMYFQLAGRVLLIFLFIGFVFSGEWNIWRIAVSLIGLVACIMVVVGFKAKASATLLVVILSIFNVLVNNFWTVCNPYPSTQAYSLASSPFSTHNLSCETNISNSHSSTSTTPTRTSPSMTSSRSSPSSVVSCCSSTAAPARSASTRRRRCTKPTSTSGRRDWDTIWEEIADQEPALALQSPSSPLLPSPASGSLRWKLYHESGRAVLQSSSFCSERRLFYTWGKSLNGVVFWLYCIKKKRQRESTVLQKATPICAVYARR